MHPGGACLLTGFIVAFLYFIQSGESIYYPPAFGFVFMAYVIEQMNTIKDKITLSLMFSVQFYIH